MDTRVPEARKTLNLKLIVFVVVRVAIAVRCAAHVKLDEFVLLDMANGVLVAYTIIPSLSSEEKF